MRNEPNESVVISMSAAELEDLMQRAVRRAFDAAGLPSIEDKDDREEAREDFRFLRFARRATYSAAAKVGFVVITLVVGGFAAALWAGFRAHMFKQ